MGLIRKAFLTVAALLVAAPAIAADIKDSENTLLMELRTGTVVIEMRPDVAPKHVERIKTLTRKGFYDGVVFHRVISGFMAQGGDPTGTGAGKSELPNLPAEFSNEKHVRGIVSMARSQDYNSANSQFFIMLASAPYLDRNYTVWGRVIEGMEHVDLIKKGNEANNGKVDNPDRIVTMRVAADVMKDQPKQ